MRNNPEEGCRQPATPFSGRDYPLRNSCPHAGNVRVTQLRPAMHRGASEARYARFGRRALELENPR